MIVNFLRISSFLTVAALALAASTAPISASATMAASNIIAVPSIAGARDLGRLPITTPIHLAIGLRLRNPAELDALIAAQSTPGSPTFRHFLTAAQAQAAFGATAADVAHTQVALRAAGFSITQTNASRTIIDVAAPSATVERYFATELHAVVVPGHAGTTYANVVPAHVPQELTTIVTSVAGLKGTVDYHMMGSTARPAARPAASPAPTPFPTPTGATPLLGPDGGYGPQAVSDAFDLPNRHGFFGNGATVASLSDGTFSDSDDVGPYLAFFRTQRTGPRSTFRLVNGGCAAPTAVCLDGLEAQANAENTIGVAPGISYMLYEIPTLSNINILDALNAIVADNRADIVDIPFEGCELLVGEAALIEDNLFKLGTAQGITFVAASFGGSNICGGAQLSVGSPADSPNVLAVGSADATIDAGGTISRPLTANVKSGGGASVLFSEPSYQAGTKGMLTTGRNVPDIAGPGAINGTGRSIFSSFIGWIGGSADNNSAPISGALAELAQINGQRLGLVNNVLYPGFATFGYTGGLFRDVTLGCNGVSGTGPFCAGTGYDHVTGVGVPDFFKIARKI